MVLIFKILTKAQWREALAAGVFAGSPVDLADGYIHFSSAETVRETARRHFSQQSDLVLVAFDAARLGDALKWEPSRGGALFPHLYSTLDPSLALWTKDLPLGADGLHLFPPDVP
jgi:uncharacterized protein (DUF952 family)